LRRRRSRSRRVPRRAAAFDAGLFFGDVHDGSRHGVSAPVETGPCHRPLSRTLSEGRKRKHSRQRHIRNSFSRGSAAPCEGDGPSSISCRMLRPFVDVCASAKMTSPRHPIAPQNAIQPDLALI
jgi:hypothetical protein